MTRMKSRLIALVAVAGLSIAGAAPASALSEREQNTLSIILGAAALGLILKEASKDKEHASRRDDDYWRKNGRNWNGRNHRTIPAQCSFPIRGARGARNVVSERCLSQFGIHRNLPRSCAFNVRIGRENRRVYGANCLQNSGFRIARYR